MAATQQATSEQSSSACADCHRACRVGVSFEVTAGGKVFRWRLCRPCFAKANAAEERDS